MSPLAKNILVLMRQHQREDDGLFWTRRIIREHLLYYDGSISQEDSNEAIDELIEAGLVVRGDCELRLRRDYGTP